MFKRTFLMCAAIFLLTTPDMATAAQASGSRDLTGLWSNTSLTTLQRPAGIAALEVSPAEAKKIVGSRLTIGYTAEETKKGATHSDPNAPPPPAGDKDFGVKGYDVGWVDPGEELGKVNGKYRTSHVIDPADGQLPYIDVAAANAKAKARGIAYATGKGPYDGPESATLSERCILNGSGGPGMLHGLYNNDFKFVLTKDYFGVAVEMGHDVRAIPIYATAQKAKASHGPLPRWQGDSVAWWEGNTLVVESTNIIPLQGDNGQFAMSPKAKVTEYFTRRGPKEIHYKFTVDDPVNYTRPWTAELTFQPVNAIFEYACAEGNYGLEGMLAGARAKDAEETSASAKRP
jgi:hypothetical protein